MFVMMRLFPLKRTAGDVHKGLNHIACSLQAAPELSLLAQNKISSAVSD